MSAPPEEPNEPAASALREVTCPECGKTVKVGSAGIKNFEKRHLNSDQCRENKRIRDAEQRAQQQRSAFSNFFRPPNKSVRTVPSTVVPPPIVSTTQPTRKPVLSAAPHPDNLPVGGPPSSDIPIRCSNAAQLLGQFRSRVEGLPDSVPLASNDHPLAAFSGDFKGSVPDDEEAWEVWNGPLDTLLQKSPEDLRSLVVRGEFGLLNLCNLLEYLARDHGIPGALLEGKVSRVMKAIDEVSPMISQLPELRPTILSPRPASAAESDAHISISSGDSTAEIIHVPSTIQSSKLTVPETVPCPGIFIKVPEGQSVHSAYPFGLHDVLGDPWDYSVTRGNLVLYATCCTRKAKRGESACHACLHLRDNDQNLGGILKRLKTGVHENSRLAFHGVGGLINIVRGKTAEIRALRLRKLNDSRKLATKAVSIDLLKQWVMAVGSGKVERVDRLVRVNLAQNGSISKLLELHELAAKGVYNTQNFTEEDDLRAILLWRLGGARVAGIAQRAFKLPSISTLRRRTLIKPLIVSAGPPKISEVEQNIKNCFEPISNEIAALSDEGILIPHQVVMFDELKVESRARVCPLTNKILGPCREHVGNTSVDYTSEKEVYLLVEALDRGEVHMAVDGTVGAIGLLSSNTRLYSARGVLISGDCKRETGTEHVKLVDTMCVASKLTGARTVSVASDGESRRGEAFIQYAFKRTLTSHSPIYDLLAPLPMMDLRTGNDDITGDKDAKHVFKRLRNLAIREKGSVVHSVHITPAVIRSHLHSNKISTERSGYLLNPKDKQNVKLAYDLLHEVWTLPEAPATSRPGFQNTRSSMQMLGSLYRHLLIPYICIDLTLSEQLIHLSAAAHTLMALFADGKAATKLMPTQLYIDIMIMIKNVYFCVAKAKVDNPRSQPVLL